MSAGSDRRWQADPELAPALEALGWPERAAAIRAFAHAEAESASAGRSANALLALPGRPERVHLRRVQHGGWLGALWGGTLLGPARPLAEWRAHGRLRGAGAPVPRPALVAAWRARGPLWRAVYGTVHVEDSRDGLAWLEGRPGPRRVARAARAVGAAIRRFHDAGGRHADLHLKNLLLRERELAAAGPEVFVIDLDGARVGSPPAPARRMRELMRLARSLEKRGVAAQVGPRGCAAALAGYCGADRALRRALLRHLPAERRRNALHALAYRS